MYISWLEIPVISIKRDTIASLEYYNVRSVISLQLCLVDKWYTFTLIYEAQFMKL